MNGRKEFVRRYVEKKRAIDPDFVPALRMQEILLEPDDLSDSDKKTESEVKIDV